MIDLLTPFFVKNCSLIAIATNHRASSLVELRDKLAIVEESCIYHHFWGARLRSEFIDIQYHNDFSLWAYHRFNDKVLAEKLNILDPTEFNGLELLRQELIETVERRLDNYEIILWTKREDQFHFIKSRLIVFNSDLTISSPEVLQEIIPLLGLSSLFYHFIDARTRTAQKKDDFSVWLSNYGDSYKPLIDAIQSIDPFFLSLPELKKELINVIQSYFKERGCHD